MDWIYERNFSKNVGTATTRKRNSIVEQNFFGVSSSPPLCTHEICAIVCKFFFSLLIFFSSIKFIWFHKKGPHKLIKGRITTISFSLSFHARHLPGAKKTTFSQNHNFLCATKWIDLLACELAQRSENILNENTEELSWIYTHISICWRGRSRRFSFILHWFIYQWVNWMNYLMLPYSPLSIRHTVLLRPMLMIFHFNQLMVDIKNSELGIIEGF